MFNTNLQFVCPNKKNIDSKFSNSSEDEQRNIECAHYKMLQMLWLWPFVHELHE